MAERATAANISDNEVKLSGSSQTAENGFVHTIRACDAPFTLSRKGGGEPAADWKGSLETSSAWGLFTYNVHIIFDPPIFLAL